MFQWIKSVIESLGYPGIVAFIFLENVFPPIPSEVILPFAGFLVERGELTLVGVTLAGTLGSVLGALPLYWLGRYWSREKLKRFFAGKGKWFMVSEENVDNSFDRFQRHGSWAVFLCRMIPGLRSLISIPAGSFGMPIGKFLILTTVGTFPWTLLLTWIGTVLGENYDRIAPYLDAISWTVVGIFLGTFVWWIFKQRRERSSR